MNVPVYKIDGSTGRKTKLEPEVFEITPNTHLVYQAVRIPLLNRRQGTHKTKARSEVRGGGKKPWRQKGRGTARAGTIRSPLWIGGGTIFGPRPRSYRKSFPVRMRQLARKSAFAMKAQDEQLRVVEDFTVESAKTRDMYAILKNLDVVGKKTLLLVPKHDRNLWLAARNIEKFEVKEAGSVSTYDVLNNQVLLIQKSALPVIKESFTKV